MPVKITSREGGRFSSGLGGTSGRKVIHDEGFSAPMAKKVSQLDRQALAWKPILKNQPRSNGPRSAAGTSSAANTALSNMDEIHAVRAKGGLVDSAYVASLAARCPSHNADAAAAIKRHDQRIAKKKPSGQMLVGIVAGVACGIGAALFLTGFFSPSKLNTLAGTLLLERRPVGDVEMRFYLAGESAPAASVVTSADGKFEIAGMRSGSYVVTLHPAGESGPAITAVYTKPESTPFKLSLSKSADNVHMYAYHKPPAPRKTPAGPSLD